MSQPPAHQANTSSSYSGQIGTGEYHRPQESWLNLQTFIYALDIGKSMIKVVKIRWLERALFFTYRSCSFMVAGRWEGSLGSFYNGINPVHQTSTFKSCFIVQRPHLPVPSYIARNFNQNYVEGIQLISHNGVIWGGGIDDGFIFESPRHRDTKDISEQPVMSVHTLMWCVRRGNLCLWPNNTLDFEVWIYEFLFHAFT